MTKTKWMLHSSSTPNQYVFWAAPPSGRLAGYFYEYVIVDAAKFNDGQPPDVYIISRKVLRR
jgi:hypothetical protein